MNSGYAIVGLLGTVFATMWLTCFFDELMARETSVREKLLTEATTVCFIDWDGDFVVEVQENNDGDDYDGWLYFSVTVSHPSLGAKYTFPARVSGAGQCEMDYYEDSWQEINMGNMFAWMWFEAASMRNPNANTAN